MPVSPETFDLSDPEIQQDPHEHYAELRRGGVQYIPANDAYLVLRHEDALTVLRDPLTFSSRLGSNSAPPPESVRDEVNRIAAQGLGRPRTLLDNDPPDHTRYRRLVSRAFTPRKMAELRPFVEAVADDLIDNWGDPSSLEFVEKFSVPLPVRVIAHSLNIPLDRHADFRRWSDASTSTIGATIPPEQHIDNARAQLELQQFFVQQFEARRTDPQDDLLTTLLFSHVGAEDDGSDAEALDMDELVRIVQQLLVAGNETTSKLINEMMLLLATTEGEWDRLKADPSRIPAVIEESLRLASPNQGMSRVATRDTTLAGVDIPEGARLVVMFASANRDEQLFECPHEMRPDRDNLRAQMAFGHGTHFCVGANLARLEASVALERLLARVESYRLHDDNTFEYLPSFVLRGLKRLHIDATMTNTDVMPATGHP
jgi:cytochrome P450